MKTLPKLITTVAALVLLGLVPASLLQAQTRQKPRDHKPPDSSQIVKMVDDLAEAVSLTDQQKDEVLKLYLEHFKQEKPGMKKEQNNQEDARNGRDDMRAKFEKQIKSLLNKEQQAKYEEFLKTQQRPPRPRR